MDLTKDAKVKEVLQEAVQQAQQQKSEAKQTARDSQQPKKVPGSADMEQAAIGPAERPQSPVHQKANQDQQDNEQLQQSETKKRTRITADVLSAPAQTDHDTASEGPSKVQKVALSFAGDDEEG